MTTFFLFLIASIVSVVAVFLLRARDEKRLRVLGAGGDVAASPRVRAVLWIVVFLPGLALLLSSQFSAFLSWFGLLTVAGWLVSAQGAGRKTDRSKLSL